MDHACNITQLPFRIKVGFVKVGTLKYNSESFQGHFSNFFSTNPNTTEALINQFSSDKTRSILQKKKTKLDFAFYIGISNVDDIDYAYDAVQEMGDTARLEVFLTKSSDQLLSKAKSSVKKEKLESILKKDRVPYSSGRSSSQNIKQLTIHELNRSIIDICDFVVFLTDEDLILNESFVYCSEVSKSHFIYSTDIGFSTDSEVTFNLNSYLRLDKFNTKLQRSNGIEKYNEEFYNNLKESFAEKPTSVEKLIDNFINQFHPFYLVASKLSGRYQKLFRLTGIFAYSGATLAVLSVALGLVFHQFSHASFFIEFMILLIILAIVVHANINKIRQHWIENRFLAERLRSAQFFFISGSEITESQLDPYTGKSSSNDWTLRAFDEIFENMRHSHQTVNLPDKTVRNFILTNWINDQIAYHKSAHKKNKKWNKRYEYLGIAAYAIALICALIHTIPFYWPHFHLPELTDNILIILALILPAIGAMAEGIRRLMEFPRNSKRYKGMSDILNRLALQFKQSASKEDAEKIMYQADQLMMREVQDWMFMQSTLKLEPVV